MGAGCDLSSLFFSIGIYVCAKCSNELFSSLATIPSAQSLLNFSGTIRNGALQRFQEKGSINSFQVACSKCLTPVGHEVVDTSHGQSSSYFTIVDKNVLRLKQSKKKTKR